MKRIFSRLFKALAAGVLLLMLVPPGMALAATTTAKYANVLVSDAGQTGNSITNSNTSTSIAVGPNGYIYVVYHGSNGIRVARSTNDGQSFDSSVKILGTDYEPSIAVSSTGTIYVSWADANGNIWIAKSTDNASTFSSPVEVGSEAADEFAVTGPRVHMAADGTHVYLIGPAGETIYVSSDNGDTFSAVHLSSTAYVFSDVHVDPVNHDVIVNEDNPSIRYYVSTNYGESFGSAVAPTGDTVNYSVGSVSASSSGHNLFIAGVGSTGYKIDPIAQTNATVTLPNDSTNQGRSIQADGYGNVVTGYSDGAHVYFAVSHDFGSSFGSPVLVTAGTSAKAAINLTNGDVMFLYTDSQGHVYLNTYANQLVGYNLNVSLSSLSFNGFSGSSSSPQTITVTNKGTSPMTITGVTTTGPFSATNTISNPIPVGGTGQISVTFHPTTTGTQTGQLSIGIQGATNPRVIQLSGTAAPPAALSVTSTSLPQATAGASYSGKLSSNGGTSPITWSVTKGALPTGLSLSSDGALSGTPKNSGSSTFTVQAKDSKGTTVSQQLTLTVNPSPSITTSTLSGATVGSKYNEALSMTGGTGNDTWSIAKGSLPSGLSLSGAGVISGTPATASTQQFTVQVKDQNGAVATKQVSLTVNPVPSISATNLPGATLGTKYTQSISISGGTGPYTWSLANGNLPSGLSLAADGQITGTPTTTGTTQFEVKVKDGNGSVTTKQVSLAVNADPKVATQSLKGATVGAKYQTPLSVTGGTGPLTWSITKGSLPTGMSLVGSTIQGTPSGAGTAQFTVQVKDANGVVSTQALSLTVNGAPSISTTTLPDGTVGANYQTTLTEANGTGSFTWTLAKGTLPNGLSLSQGGELTGKPSTSGSSTFTVQVTDSNGVTSTKQLTLKINPVPSITTSSLPVDTAGIQYQQALTLTGGTSPDTWTVAKGSLPTGLSLSKSGMITGTPTSSSNGQFTVQVTDANGASATKTLSLAVNGKPSISTSVLSDATQGTTYQKQLNITGGTGPFTWSLPSGSLPSGMTLSNNGALSGVPTATGSYKFTVQVKDSTGAVATQQLSLTVDATPAITMSTLPGATVGAPYKQTLSMSGGLQPLVWKLVQGSLPQGLTLSQNGTLSGTPASVGVSQFTIVVTDANGATGTHEFKFTTHAVPSISIKNVPGATMGGTYHGVLPVNNGTGPFTWILSHGQLPSGLTLHHDGTITGSPVNIGLSQFLIQVTDANGVQANKQVSMQVNPTLLITTKTLPMVLQGKTYQESIQTTGGTDPIHFTVASGSLPGGLTLNPDGSITGTAASTGMSQFTITATDANGVTAAQAYTLYVIPAAPTETLKKIDGQNIVGSQGTTLKAVQGQSTAVLQVPNGAYTMPIQMNLTTGSVPSNLLGSSSNFVAAFGVNFNRNYVPKKPVVLTIYNPNITTNSTIYKISNGKLVPVHAVLSPGKAVISFTSDPDFVVANQTTPNAVTAHTVVPKATSPVTGKPFLWNYIFGSALLAAGGGMLVIYRKKKKY